MGPNSWKYFSSIKIGTNFLKIFCTHQDLDRNPENMCSPIKIWDQIPKNIFHPYKNRTKFMKIFVTHKIWDKIWDQASNCRPSRPCRHAMTSGAPLVNNLVQETQPLSAQTWSAGVKNNMNGIGGGCKAGIWVEDSWPVAHWVESFWSASPALQVPAKRKSSWEYL